MKKIKYLFLSTIVLVLSASCNDALEIIQDGELDDAATFQTTEDLYKYLQGSVYSSVGGSNEIMLSAVFTDETGIGPSNGGQEIDLHRFNLNQSTGYVASLWGNHYTVINRVNRLLRAAEGITPDPNVCIGEIEGVDADGNDICILSERDAYFSIIAQARALRAYSYMQLSVYFSTDMSDEEALGVILIDYVPATDEKLPRVKNKLIFDLIEEDLAFAKDNLGDTAVLFEYQTDYKMTNANMINAIYARYNLYRKKFDLAKYYANLVINNSGITLAGAVPYSPSTFYTATTTNPYRRIWADLGQGEVIYALSRPSGGNWGNIAGSFFFNTTEVSGGAFLDMGRNLYNSLNSVAGDIRFNAFVDPTSLIDNNYLNNPNYVKDDALIIDKYPGKTGEPLRNDIKIFRLSEMYFILAEVAAHGGQLNEVGANLKVIRDARNRNGAQAAPTFSNATAAFAAIMDEKRKEFCFEGHRFLDIKRLGVLANKSIDRSPADDIIPTLPLTISNTDYRFTLPIPQAEISANTGIVQNPGY